MRKLIIRVTSLGFGLLSGLIGAAPAQAGLPPLGFAADTIHCKMEWSSATAYQPLIAEGSKKLHLEPLWEDSPHNRQEIVKNTDHGAGPLWRGGVEVQEFSDTEVLATIYLQGATPDPFGKNMTLAETNIRIPAAAAHFPEMNLSLRVPKAEEKHGGERDWITLVLSCEAKN